MKVSICPCVETPEIGKLNADAIVVFLRQHEGIVDFELDCEAYKDTTNDDIRHFERAIRFCPVRNRRERDSNEIPELVWLANLASLGQDHDTTTTASIYHSLRKKVDMLLDARKAVLNYGA